MRLSSAVKQQVASLLTCLYGMKVSVLTTKQSRLFGNSVQYILGAIPAPGPALLRGGEINALVRKVL